MSVSVSIIIPAYNASETLSHTLASLLRQTCSDWEAIIVDDGSTDNTSAIASELIQQDSRIRLITQSQQGVSAARNAGAERARYEWLLFLDADDWIAPTYLERMTASIVATPNIDVIHCGWVRVARDGSWMDEQHPPQCPDMFPTLARYCPFAMHSCMVNRSVFMTIGGFDSALATCEDWDLWQRIARQGKKFAGVPEVLAFYQIRVGSLSRNADQFLKDGLHVLKMGCMTDTRIPNPLPKYANGYRLPSATLHPFYFATWTAGLLIGAGEDARSLLRSLDGNAPGLMPYQIADTLFESILLPTCSPIGQWWKLWEHVHTPLRKFLVALENLSQAPGLVQRVLIRLERLILQQKQTPFPIQIGETHGLLVDVCEPLKSFNVSKSVVRLYGKVVIEGQFLGIVELPVCDACVSELVLKDKIAAQYWWEILGNFFEKTKYQADDNHDQLGWLTFLRQVWDRPTWSQEHFYDSEKSDLPTRTVRAENDELTVEISEELPNVLVSGPVLKVTFTVGGMAIGRLDVPTKKRELSGQALRVALTLGSGLELGRAVVREALIGQQHISGVSIRDRLAQTAQKRRNANTDIDGMTPLLASEMNAPHRSTLFALGQRGQGVGTSSSRWAVFPTEIVEEMVEMTIVTQEPIALVPESGLASANLAVYAPSMTTRRSEVSNEKGLRREEPFKLLTTQKADIDCGHNNRSHFESIFAIQADPWRYTTPYEQTKYQQTLSLLPPDSIDNALELACAEGHFTIQLAPRVTTLLATDVSQIAVDRTAQRCSHLANVQFKQLDMAIDPLPSALDLIVCSEVLYYIGDRQVLRHFAQKIADALQEDGYFLTAHAHLVVDEPTQPGFDWDHPFGAKGISDMFKKVKTLRLVKEIRTPLYRIQLFQKRAHALRFPWKREYPILTTMEQPTAPPARVAETVLWQGGQPRKVKIESVTTDRLPILTYHRILSSGSQSIQDWCLNADVFEAQLRYLRDAGYYSISLATWQHAMITRTALPGRAVVLTFDDGYLDFFTHAYPLLNRYGFSATVFLVASHVGRSNQWDASYGESVPLMDWSHIHQLQAQGIEFGSHTMSHSPLTALSIAAVAQEGLRSRTLLSQKLGCTIQSIAYPYGDTDPVIEHMMGACGYTLGLTCRSSLSQLQDDLLSLPRLEVKRSDRLPNFIRMLSG